MNLKGRIGKISEGYNLLINPFNDENGEPLVDHEAESYENSRVAFYSRIYSYDKSGLEEVKQLFK